MNTGKKWTFATLGLLLLLLIGAGGITAVIDPFFHYHKPLEGLSYPINNARYQNDGIVKHFAYDAIITGSSMTQNFKASEFDEIFGVNSVKVAYAGAYYKEINENLERAVESNSQIRYILRGLDYRMFLVDKDTERYEEIPTYLYDKNPFNDVNYLLNKEVLLENSLHVLAYTRGGNLTTNFDDYNNWMEGIEFGKEAVDKTYERAEKAESQEPFTQEDLEMVRGNIEQNVTSLIEANPQITFYLFITPYSIYYFDSLLQSGNLERQLDAEKAAIEMILKYENVRLFSFFDNFEMITDLDNYKDVTHYHEDINSEILRWMYEGEYELTKDNYLEYCARVRDFYLTYDYDAMF